MHPPLPVLQPELAAFALELGVQGFNILLQRVAGIGREIADTAAGAGRSAGGFADTPQKREAVEALVSLGYGQTESIKAVNAIPDIENMDSGAILKAALKKMF